MFWPRELTHSHWDRPEDFPYLAFFISCVSHGYPHMATTATSRGDQALCLQRTDRSDLIGIWWPLRDSTKKLSGCTLPENSRFSPLKMMVSKFRISKLPGVEHFQAQTVSFREGKLWSFESWLFFPCFFVAPCFYRYTESFDKHIILWNSGTNQFNRLKLERFFWACFRNTPVPIPSKIGILMKHTSFGVIHFSKTYPVGQDRKLWNGTYTPWNLTAGTWSQKSLGVKGDSFFLETIMTSGEPCEISGEYWTAYYLIVVLGWLKHHTYSVMAKWGRWILVPCKHKNLPPRPE